jgi:hypothetical protein
VPAHTPVPLHTSLLVQAKPSLQVEPEGLLTGLQPPMPSHATLAWHGVGAGHE